ncbi:hypothetical protein [Leucobacter chromiireducens]|uniref:hypothetical protein n=1 Tax=Leucobacter chromiireducens TaxID=283877 RepID=UPI000F635AA5|nr:hypothetical protein [Leucobacter chromiireducens]
MKKLSTMAQRLADEIKEQDWSDAHSRLDGSRHSRTRDRKGGAQLSDEETDRIRMNVIWVTGQALADDDPNFDIRAFAEAAGASSGMLWRKDGGPNRGLEAGLRRSND